MLHNRVTFTETKGGKHRTVPISDEVMVTVKTKQAGLLFDVSYQSYRKILKEIKPDLPNGQTVHVLRHTFAAYFDPDYLLDAIKFNSLKGCIYIPSTLSGENGHP
ncbi:hypothetical protein [Xenorhabdus sp. SGI246]|uniref:hypothetical protein n=1 Tax=Xenorhabdus sp. SGI246 TaxID=3158263 RepID=UPI00349FA214